MQLITNPEATEMLDEALDETFKDSITFLRDDQGEWYAVTGVVNHDGGLRCLDRKFWKVMDEDEMHERLDYWMGDDQ